MWAAIRYRRAQAAALMLLSALIATCAALAPLYTRSSRAAAQRRLPGRPGGHRADRQGDPHAHQPRPRRSHRLAQVVPADVRALHKPGIGTYNGQVDVQQLPERPTAPLDLIYRDRMCDHVRITQGACPSGRGEIAVTAAEAAFWKWRLGKTFSVTERDADHTEPQALTIVGVYEQVPDDAYWMRLKLDGRSGGTIS